MATAVEAIVDFLQAEVTFVDPTASRSSADAYVAELTALDGEVVELVESIPEERRCSSRITRCSATSRIGTASRSSAR